MATSVCASSVYSQKALVAAPANYSSDLCAYCFSVFRFSLCLQKWHECELTLKPPYLYLTEHEDTKMEVRFARINMYNIYFFRSLHIKRRRSPGSEKNNTLRATSVYRYTWLCL